MGFEALRSFIGPLSRTLISRASTPSVLSSSLLGASPSPKHEFRFPLGFLLHSQSSCAPFANQLHGLTSSLTDTRFPKRRLVDKPRRKRAASRPPVIVNANWVNLAGPYAWVKYVPGEPILPNNPNEGSVKGRNEKKRMRQRREFIKAEAKKRKAELQEANRKKRNKRVERKMAAVARERAWAERLAELQQLEEEKKRTMA